MTLTFMAQGGTGKMFFRFVLSERFVDRRINWNDFKTYLTWILHSEIY